MTHPVGEYSTVATSLGNTVLATWRGNAATFLTDEKLPPRLEIQGKFWEEAKAETNEEI
jgi:hypothetical protein